MMVPIQVIRWYRMQCYDGTDSCAIVVPIRRYCQFVQVDKALKTVTQFPDTVSPQIKEGLADIRYQTGPLVSNYPKLLKAVATGNVKDMANESKVYFWDNKKKAMSFDKKRFDTRMKENFHYRNGGHLSRKVLRQLSKDFRTINHLA